MLDIPTIEKTKPLKKVIFLNPDDKDIKLYNNLEFLKDNPKPKLAPVNKDES